MQLNSKNRFALGTCMWKSREHISVVLFLLAVSGQGENLQVLPAWSCRGPGQAEPELLSPARGLWSCLVPFPLSCQRLFSLAGPWEPLCPTRAQLSCSSAGHAWSSALRRAGLVGLSWQGELRARSVRRLRLRCLCPLSTAELAQQTVGSRAAARCFPHQAVGAEAVGRCISVSTAELEARSMPRARKRVCPTS